MLKPEKKAELVAGVKAQLEPLGDTILKTPLGGLLDKLENGEGKEIRKLYGELLRLAYEELKTGKLDATQYPIAVNASSLVMTLVQE